MMLSLGRVLPDHAGKLAAGVGALAACGAWRWSTTPGGALLWCLVLAIACAGYGGLLDRLGGASRSIGMTVVSGLACMLVGSTVLARLGVLTVTVQFAVVALGLIACAFGRLRAPLPKASVTACIAIAACILIGMKLCSGETWLADGINHPMAVKQLWDTGALGALGHQAGAQIVGESYLAVIGGPITAGAFDGGLCAGLLLVLLATELAERSERLGLSLFVVLLVPVVLNPDYAVHTARFSGTVFVVAMFVALDRAIGERRDVWRVLPFAAALVAIRYEFVLLAAPYAIAAVLFDRPRSRGSIAAAAIAMVAIVALVHGKPFGVVLGLAATAASFVAARGVVAVVSTYTWRSTLFVAVFAAVLMALGSALRVIPATAHSRSALAILVWGTAFSIFLLIGRSVEQRDRDEPRLRLVPAAMFLVIISITMSLGVNFDSVRRKRLRDRYIEVLVRFQAIRIEGYDLERDRVARSLQDAVPAGAAIGFWGVSGSGLDFARNPIRDVSWVRERFLTRLEPRRLAGLDYLIVQTIEPPVPPTVDPWGELIVSPTAKVAASLRWIATRDSISLYRVER